MSIKIKQIEEELEQINESIALHDSQGASRMEVLTSVMVRITIHIRHLLDELIRRNNDVGYWEKETRRLQAELANKPPSKDKPHCCHIGCQDQAMFDITFGNTSDDNTQSCLKHVSDLLTDASEHVITRLPLWKQQSLTGKEIMDELKKCGKKAV